MLFFPLLAAAGLTAVPAGAAAVVTRRETGAQQQAFHIPFIHAFSPNGRPGSDPYCSVDFTITDTATDTTTRCAAQRGPCSYADPDAPEKPLDAAHPAACEDPSFSFYVAAWAYVSNYSIVVERVLADGGELHRGPITSIDARSYRDSFQEICMGSGSCDAWIRNETHPIVIPFV